MAIEFTDQSFCQCPETLLAIMDDPYHDDQITGYRRIAPPPNHSCFYVQIRNACIERADQEAWRLARREWRHTGPPPELLISQHFARLMDLYCAQAWTAARKKVPTGPSPARVREFYLAYTAIAEGRA